MTYRTTTEIAALVNAFEDCTLPRSQWTHAAHLTVALWYLTHHLPSDAINCIRAGIQRYNAANGIRQTRESGYHETMTLFWIWLGQWFLADSRSSSFAPAMVNRFLMRCGNPALPLHYYTRDRLMSWEARISWVEPDLKPLP